MHDTLNGLFLSALHRGSTPALTYLDASGTDHDVSYEDLYRKACWWAGHLDATTSLGSYVAIIGSPSPEWYAAFVGVQLAGATAAPLSPLYAPQELRQILGRLRPAAILLGEGLREDTLQELRRGYSDFVTALPDAGSPVPSGITAQHLDPKTWRGRVSATDHAVVLHTSGTTGLPKAALQTHANYAGYAHFCGALTIRPGERVLSFLSPTHQAGLLLTFISAMAQGGHVTQLERFTPSAFWAAVRRHQCTVSVLMSPGPARLLAEPPSADDHDHTLRRALGGSTPTEQRRAMLERFGVVFSHEQMGSTETTLFALSGSLDRQQPWPAGGLVGPLGGSLGGHLVPGWSDVRIADPLTDAVLIAEVLGEIQVHGAGVFDGYLRDPEQSRAVFTQDGWFRTGDLGYQDASGGVYWVDRIKSMIRRSGENVSPAEVEQVVAQFPGVRQVAAFGVPDPIRGEEIMIAIVAEEGASIVPAELVTHCRDRLSAFKVPRYVELRDDLPRTVSHKVRTDALKDDWRDRVQFDLARHRTPATGRS